MMRRRTFLSVTGGIALANRSAEGSSFPIIDSHVHLYDPTRPQGVPWPDPKQAGIYRTFLPADYRKIAEPFGIVGMIAMECSPWVEDNYWVLDVAARDTVVVGTVGSLHPSKPDFSEHLSRLHKNPLFRGIRFDYHYGLNLTEEIRKPEFISNMSALAEAGLVLDGSGSASLLTDFVRITDKAPGLRVVIDHLPRTETPEEPSARAAYEQARRELGSRPQVYVKVSEIFQRFDQKGRRVATGGRVPRGLSYYRQTLDTIYEIFGPNRLLFCSNWTQGELMGTFPEMLNLVREYFTGKGREVAEKFFFRNSAAAYRWVRRRVDQPQVSEARREKRHAASVG